MPTAPRSEDRSGPGALRRSGGTIAVAARSSLRGRRIGAAIDSALTGSGDDGRVVMVHLGGALPAAASVLVIGDMPDPITDLVPALAAVPELERIVLVSSAMVYGAWPDNPVPLTEDALLRPNPGCEPAAAAAEAERVAREWADERGCELVILRPATGVGGDAPAVAPVRDAGSPAQFLHEDDLASAVALAATGGLSRGAFNVAPDHWVEAGAVDALIYVPIAMPRPVVAVLGRLAETVAGPPPPIAAYRHHPWVVANDRLRARGWQPLHTHEEAWVSSHQGSALTELSPSRRQLLALGATSGALAAGIGGVVLALRRRRLSGGRGDAR